MELKQINKIVAIVLVSASCIFFADRNQGCADEARPLTPRETWAARAEYERTHTPQPHRFRRKNWEIVPETFLFFYEEPGISVEWEGVMAGIRVTRNLSLDPVLAILEGRLSGGHVDYDGFLSNGTPHTDSGEDYTFESRMLIGPDLFFEETVLTPFFGLGYRFWYDNLESPNAYERRVQYLYSPVGMETNSLLGKHWSWGIRAEFDIFWRGWVKSFLSDVDPGFNDPSNRQERGYGARGSAYLRRSVNEKTSVSIEPFIRYWDIDDSNTAPVTFASTLIGGGYEPANRTIETGLQISILF